MEVSSNNANLVVEGLAICREDLVRDKVDQAACREDLVKDKVDRAACKVDRVACKVDPTATSEALEDSATSAALEDSTKTSRTLNLEDSTSKSQVTTSSGVATSSSSNLVGPTTWTSTANSELNKGKLHD